MVPKTVAYGKIKAKAAAKRAQLSGAAGGRSGNGSGGGVAAHEDPPHPRQRPANGSGSGGGSNKKHKASASSGGGGRSSLNGGATISGLLTATPAATNANADARQASEPVDPNDQLQFEASQARGEPGEGGDVEMTG